MLSAARPSRSQAQKKSLRGFQRGSLAPMRLHLLLVDLGPPLLGRVLRILGPPKQQPMLVTTLVWRKQPGQRQSARSGHRARCVAARFPMQSKLTMLEFATCGQSSTDAPSPRPLSRPLCLRQQPRQETAE